MSRIYVPVDDVVNEFMIGIDDGDYIHGVSRGRVRNLAYHAVRDLQFDTLKNISKVILPIDENTQMCILPEDFVDYVRVGIMNAHGQFLPMSKNPNMNINQRQLEDNLGNILLDDDGVPLTSYDTTSNAPVTRDNNPVLFTRSPIVNSKGGLFGIGGGYSGNGQFIFDKTNNRIKVDSSISTQEIVLEYVADESMKKSPRILTYAVEAVMAYVYWSLINKKVNISPSEKVMARQRYELEKKKVRARVNKLTKADIMFQIGKRSQSAPKDSGRIYS